MNPDNTAEKDSSYFHAMGTLLQGLKDWASVPENFPYGLSALFFNYMLYQSELVPRWLSGWGLAGGALMLITGLLRLYGRKVIYLATPIILSEMVLAVWLIIKGLDLSTATFTIVGVLFIVALVSTTMSGTCSKSTNAADYLTAISANKNKVLTGVLFQLILTASVVAIPILMFPILREQNVGLALAYVVARIFEGFFDVVIAISQLLLLTLSREYVRQKI